MVVTLTSMEQDSECKANFSREYCVAILSQRLRWCLLRILLKHFIYLYVVLHVHFKRLHLVAAEQCSAVHNVPRI